MQIILSENCGFCKGAERSFALAEQAKKQAETNRTSVYCLHPLVHNKIAVEKLGIPVQTVENFKAGEIAVVSAHGATPETFLTLRERGVTVVDATCPAVKAIHRTAADYASRGYCVLLVGDENHVELQVTAGYCKNNFQIVLSPEEIDFSVAEKYVLLPQTTLPPEKFEDFQKNITFFIRKFNKILEIRNTICYTTYKRQEEAIRMSKICDCFLVVGDKTSANSRRLCETVSKNGAETYLIESKSDLESVKIEKNKQALGIISGASTPKELIMEVFYRMSEEKQTVLDQENVAKLEETTPVVETTAKVAEQGKESMDELMKSVKPPKNYHENMRLKVMVIKSDITGISVAIENGGKNDSGFISKDEAEIDGTYDPANYVVGQTLDVIMIPKNPDKPNDMNLSKKRFDEMKIDDEHVQKILAGEEFSLDKTSVIKGGLLGKIGSYTIFIPASQIRMGYVGNLEEYANKPLRLRALPPREEEPTEDGKTRKPNPKRIVASQRVILEEEKAARDDEFWSKIYKGAKVTGKVKRFADFGAFVSLKYMDGLVHNSDLTWSKRKDTKPADILELNKVYEFVVKEFSRETGRISLSYRELQKKPNEIAQEKYPVGTIVAGKVAKIVKYGVFVELEPGIDGLVHISQIQQSFLQNINESSLKEGDEVNVKIVSYEGEKITLSIKEALPVVEEPVVAPVDEEEGDDDKGAKGGKDKKGKKVKENGEEEGPHSHFSGSSHSNLGALFGSINIPTED